MSRAAITLVRTGIILLWLYPLTPGRERKQTKWPVISDKPFIVVWNAPTANCKSVYGIDLGLDVFDIVANQNATFIGQNITIFYYDNLGYYPYYTAAGASVNGGVPQNGSLKAHLAKAQADMEKEIPLTDYSGLSVIDWEAWRPSWIRNWAKQAIYRQKSEELVREEHPRWPESQVTRQAQVEFEQEAQAFMGQTLKLAKGLRPSGLWGYYGFPCCYNSIDGMASENYTGKCPDVEKERNDRLGWLWRESVALYPSIYLNEQLRSSQRALKYVHHRVGEALRLAEVRENVSLPVLPYARIVYVSTMDILTQIDLVHTIGESAAMGAAGVVLWGNGDYARSQESCEVVKAYISGVLGHYIVNVTSAAALCARALCSSHGRCVRKDEGARIYLHLNPETFTVRRNLEPGGPHFLLWGNLAEEDLKRMQDSFQCQCYWGWKGTHCQECHSIEN
uniref:Hyaluronidase n=1 Tax=Callorhinchus milii TaxID=7868 RepID=V9KVI3_CALMI